MGTRGLTCVVLDGEFKVAQYGQWDHYPGGQGATIYEFLKKVTSNGGLPKFKEAVRNLRAATHEEIKAAWIECGDPDDGSGFVTIDVSKRVSEVYPQFQRDLAAGILERIANGDVDAVDLRTEFAADSLFCEWCYVVNLDDDVLEVCKGFQTEPHSAGRFADMPRHIPSHNPNYEYWPVAEVARFKFSELPETVDEFVNICDPPEDEDE